ncbi:hypothetical protein [Flavobacterium sp.]|uniref:hypothetical protein n=1 Tax=Flavobacterium sp. TaxID=239 RepID=UPI003D2D212C
MKKLITVMLVVFGISTNYAQENNEQLGDNFSLEGALEMFKKSKSLEEFEKLINLEDSNVNNLDLNEDGEIDYINVESIKDGDTHVVILSTYLNEKDIQDIATIGIEKTGKEEAVLQIEGDENLYAANTYVEPYSVENKIETSDYGPNEPIVNPYRVVVNVWFWPCVKFMYRPGYVVWKSPYRWKKYPSYWKPWKRTTYMIFKGRCVRYNTHFHRTTKHRVIVAKKIYSPRRKVVVRKSNNKTNVTKRRSKIRRR